MLWGVTGLTQLGEVNGTHESQNDSRVLLYRGGVNKGSPRTSFGAEMTVTSGT